ncbi:hypothetical protein CLOM_g8768 [Closterium sp. NIES-68]|nr:hypothetical protein CLOM_g21458 [Closterium sp. NIES-68]GJP49576.1 hypothetical protein CLOM_g8768 [Closterium sp. NIES-68]GJP62804.1 hypothetical protein CLOP_g19830 [Closterium sp. NIES-67]GJP77442.1 hypothetical protein CLOP_g7837 [Closterium sp. NIES-67]
MTRPATAAAQPGDLPLGVLDLLKVKAAAPSPVPRNGPTAQKGVAEAFCPAAPQMAAGAPVAGLPGLAVLDAALTGVPSSAAGAGGDTTAATVAAETAAPASDGMAVGALDAAEFRAQGHRMVEFIAQYLETVESMPVRSTVQPGYLRHLLPPQAPEHGEPFEATLKDISSAILPGLTHWQSPSFFAFFSSTTSNAAILADALISALNVVGFSWIAAPAATELETLVLDWLADLLGLPDGFHSTKSGGVGGGVIHGTASEAGLVALLAARRRALDRLAAQGGLVDAGPGACVLGATEGGSSASNGIKFPWHNPEDVARQRLVAYFSDQTHACVEKACRVAGIPECNMRVLPTTAASAHAITPEVLLSAIQRDEAAGLIPFFLTLTVGTTSSTAIDPIAPLAAIAKAHGMWVHVDAAYAGMACMCPEMRHHLEGVHLVDSLASNAHKWLLTSFDCTCLWTQDSKPLVKALSMQPEYLRNKASELQQVVDYKDWEIPIGRRFRSLKLWMVLRSYGAEGIRAYIRRHVALAQWFEEAVRQDGKFELMAPRPFALVCFRLKPLSAGARGGMGGGGEDGGRELNAALLEAINSSGKAYLTHTVLSGHYVLRMAIGAVKTEMRHVQAAWELIQMEASKLLQEVESYSARRSPLALEGA